MHLFGDTAFVSNSCKDQMVRLMPMWQERGTRPGHTTMRHYILLLNTVRIVNIVNHCNYLSPPIFACNHLRTWISNPEKDKQKNERMHSISNSKSWIWTHYVKMRRQNKNDNWPTSNVSFYMTPQSSLSLALSAKNMFFLLG